MSLRTDRLVRVLPVVLLLALVLPGLGAEPRVVVGKHVSANAMILQREAAKPFQAVKQGADLSSGDLLVGIPGAVLDSKNGAVRLSLLSDLEGTSVFPVLESAVVLHASDAVDLDFTLDRGRVDLTNRKEKGAAKARVRFRNEVWDLTLAEPGTWIGLEIYGRWPRGVFFHKDDKPQKEPTAELILIVLKGAVDLKAGNRHLALHAPPGPAFYHWDSVASGDTGPQRLEKLPPWADPTAKPSPEAKERLARIDQLRQQLEKDGPSATAAAWVKSKTPGERRAATIALGAVDNLAGLLAALGNETHADVRDHAVMVLRHWLGRGPGQDLKLYEYLTKEQKYSPAHADLLLRLLHSFGEVDLGLPETYEALIAYLNHDRLAIRELARWQLYRLVPAGKNIAYDAAGSAKEREAAAAAWKKIVPEGKLPAKAKE